MTFAVLMTRNDNSSALACYTVRDRITGTCWTISLRLAGWYIWRDEQLMKVERNTRAAFDYVERRLGNLGLATRTNV